MLDDLQKHITDVLGNVWELKNIKQRATRTDLDGLETKLLRIGNIINSSEFMNYQKDIEKPRK